MTFEPSRMTRGLVSGLNSDPLGAVIPPIYLSTNYGFEFPGDAPDYDYVRAGNPTRRSLEEALATLEAGAGCITTASGMAAVTLVVETFVPVGGRVIAPHDCYGGTWRLLQRLADKGRLQLDLVDLTDLDTAVAALATPAALVWVETPSNPLMRLTDIAAIAAARPEGALLVVDNTFCSPALQRPIEHGADLVVHSTTKFVNGHSDSLGGAVIAASPEHAEDLATWCNTLGLPGAAFDAWLTLRGLRTLDARMRVHEGNAAAVVAALVAHPAVTAVHHPSLPEHPGHELAARQQSGFGSVLSFEIAGGLPAVTAFAKTLQVFTLAESLGGTESLAAHPATMTHASMPPQIQAAAGITDGLVRLSVGLEQPEDLVADLLEALDATTAG
ncbi:MAG TPA: PLP-dependent transferase [Candidatus Luteococcus avicola]|nr:PLP-dependent transferase [Candidatus Luteococcus avicola]